MAQSHCYSALCSFIEREFSTEWWGWLIATGTFMAFTWGSKVNGILTVITIGIAVLIDLWDILDIKKGHSMVSSILFSVLLTFMHNMDRTTLLGILQLELLA
jgi:dolichyl-phosphate-mannose--protein O-mannosyl transferase